MIHTGRERLARIGCPGPLGGISLPNAWAALPYLGFSTVTATLGIVRLPMFLTRTVKVVCCASRWAVGNELTTATGKRPCDSPARGSVPPQPATNPATASAATAMTLRPLTGFEHTQGAGGVSVASAPFAVPVALCTGPPDLGVRLRSGNAA